jgi:hypothetical protein
MDAGTRRQVRRRAHDTCEYCRLAQASALFLSFHIEHIVAVQHGGADALDNLALACPDCNRHKGPNLSSVDPMTGNVVPLFHPRQHDWAAHFSIRDALIVGQTETGRATVRRLRFNDSERLSMRMALQSIGEWPS